MSETKTTYKRRLADPRWQKRRLEVLNRDNFTTYFSDNQYTLDKVSFKIGNALYICYFPTGHYDTFSSEDISQFYHLMMI